MNIKNKLKEAGILIGVFIVAVLVFSYFTNKGNDNMTADIGTATFPKIGFDCGGYGINAVPGYAQSMDIPTIRDTITPVLSGKLNVEINAYENAISSMEYKVYSLDGTEALLEKKIKKPGKTEMLDLNKSGLLDEERVLEIILNYNKEKTVHFYTRIADAEKADIQQCLDYVTTFHNGALNKEEGVGVGKAIEPNEDGDNSTFAHVTIHSNYDQVSYGELEPKLEGGERWEIKEMNDTSSSIQAEFIVRCKGEENEDDLYKVREFFRVRYDSYAKRGYLLDYDRTMEQIFDPTKKVLSEKGVLLGISEYDVPYLNDKDGSIVSFVQADDLWSYNKETDEVSLVFSFAASENTDERNLTNQHEIQLLETDGNGNVTFAVYGYMNRGEHEGQVGVAVYYYNVEQSSVEEKVFIPTDTSWGNAIHELGKLVYYSVDREMLYVLAGDTFYETNVEKEKTKELVTGLTEDHYVVSSDGRFLAYQSKSGENGANELTIMNLSSGKTRTVTGKEGENIYPLGFVKNDFVYGTSRIEDAGQTAAGEDASPMYKVEIQNSKGKTVKTYEQKEIYILGAKMEKNRVILERAVRDGSIYTATAEEYISNNEEQKESNIYLDSYVTELKKKQMRLTYEDGISDKEPKVLKPKQVMFENPTTITFDYDKKEKQYYVYGYGKLQGSYEIAGDAIQKADSYGGVVVDQSQSYIWERGNRDLNYTIDHSDEVMAQLKAKLNEGASPIEVMKELGSGTTLDLTGCTSEQLAYIINQGKPVIGIQKDGKAIILVGYTDTDIIYVDAASGERKTSTFEEMDALTAGTGHTYIG